MIKIILTVSLLMSLVGTQGCAGLERKLKVIVPKDKESTDTIKDINPIRLDVFNAEIRAFEAVNFSCQEVEAIINFLNQDWAKTKQKQVNSLFKLYSQYCLNVGYSLNEKNKKFFSQWKKELRNVLWYTRLPVEIHTIDDFSVRQLFQLLDAFLIYDNKKGEYVDVKNISFTAKNIKSNQ